MSSPANDLPPDAPPAPCSSERCTVVVHENGRRHEIEVVPGTVLRRALQQHGFSPHGSVTTRANCGGHGHCGACAVEIPTGAPTSNQWLDRGLAAIGAGRLSCQVEVDRDMVVHL